VTDEHLIKTIRAELPQLSARGFPTTAVHVGELCKRFETLQAAHKGLAEREEKLTQRLVALEP
jgi:hypothetical protein